MTSSNAVTIQKPFTKQAKNFETKSMNFTKQEYLEHAGEKHIIKKEKSTWNMAFCTVFHVLF